MEYVQIKDVCSTTQGIQIPKSDQIEILKDGYIRYLYIADFKGNNDEKFISDNYEDKRVTVNDLVMANTGSPGVVFKGKNGILSNNLFKITFNRKIIDRDFLYYYLSSNKFQEVLQAQMKGGIQKHLGHKTIGEQMIPVVNIDTQKQIVNILDKAEQLIDNRKEQIQACDELVKSQFIEMFGDPVLNPKQWSVRPVIELCDCMVPGRDKPKSFTGDTPWITIDDLKVNGVTYHSKSNLGLTDKEIVEVKRKKVPQGSVLMSCVGNLGICSIAGKPLIINQQLHSFQCSEEVNNYYLMYYLGCRKDYMNKNASSTTVLYMNKTICNSIPIMLPPIELQNQFAQFVQQVDKLKFDMQRSLIELEDNFNSLMQRAFKGELF